MRIFDSYSSGAHCSPMPWYGGKTVDVYIRMTPHCCFHWQNFFFVLF